MTHRTAQTLHFTLPPGSLSYRRDSLMPSIVLFRAAGYKSGMRVLRCPSKEQMAYDAAVAGADRIRAALRQKGKATIVLAAGMSQAAMLEFLVHENLDWSGVTAFHSDEYVGIGPEEPGSFRKFLQDRVFQWIKPRAFHAICGERNPISELRR